MSLLSSNHFQTCKVKNSGAWERFSMAWDWVTWDIWAREPAFKLSQIAKMQRSNKIGTRQAGQQNQHWSGNRMWTWTQQQNLSTANLFAFGLHKIVDVCHSQLDINGTTWSWCQALPDYLVCTCLKYSQLVSHTAKRRDHGYVLEYDQSDWPSGPKPASPLGRFIKVLQCPGSSIEVVDLWISR